MNEQKRALILTIIALAILLVGLVVCLMKWPAGIFLMVGCAVFPVYNLYTLIKRK